MSKELEKDYLEVCFKRIKNLQVCVDYEKDIVKNVDEILPNSCNKVEQALQRLESIDNAEPSEALKTLEVLDNTISPLLEPILAEYEDDLSDKITANYFALKQTLIKAQEDKRFIELILNKPQLLNVFALDGVHTWEEFEDTFSDEDKEYINTTKEEYEYMRNQLIKRGKIDE